MNALFSNSNSFHGRATIPAAAPCHSRSQPLHQNAAIMHARQAGTDRLRPLSCLHAGARTHRALQMTHPPGASAMPGAAQTVPTTSSAPGIDQPGTGTHCMQAAWTCTGLMHTPSSMHACKQLLAPNELPRKPCSRSRSCADIRAACTELACKACSDIHVRRCRSGAPAGVTGLRPSLHAQVAPAPGSLATMTWMAQVRLDRTLAAVLLVSAQLAHALQPRLACKPRGYACMHSTMAFKSWQGVLQACSCRDQRAAALARRTGDRITASRPACS